MAPLWMLLRSELRSRWRTWLALAVLTGVTAGLVLAVASAARRTDSALARHRDSTGTMHVWVARGSFFGLDVDFSRVERLPQVVQAVRSVDLAFWGRTEDGRRVTNDEVELAVPTTGRDPAQQRPKILAGRAPDPTARDEILVGHRAADHYDLHVGDTLRMRFATRRELARIAATGEHDPNADPATAGTGPLLTLRVVGVRADLQADDGLMFVTMSPAFHRAYGRTVGTWLELTGVRLKRGDADLAAFRAGVERIAAGKPFELYEKRIIQGKLQSSIHVQVQALWLVAAVGGLAALVLIAQALARHSAMESADYPVLRSLGLSRRRLFALGVVRVLPIGVGAGAIAAGVAIALSPLAPVGAARIAEPDPGLAVDALVCAVGALATAAVVVLAVLAPAWATARRETRHEQDASSATVDLLTRAGLTQRRLTGVRMALDPGRGRSAVPVRSTLAAAVVGVAAVTAGLTVSVSAERLLDTPALYGHNWDAVIGHGTEPKYPASFVERLVADRSIAHLAGGTVKEAQVNGRPLGILGMTALRGSAAPTVIEGRAATAPTEIVLGSGTARDLGAGIGDEVDGRIGRRTSRFRVVGVGVLPELITSGVATAALGQGAATTFEGLRRLAPRASQNIFALGLASSEQKDVALSRLERQAGATVPRRPAEVANWGRVRGFPYLLAALVASVALAVLAHALVTSVRRRRRELAILKTLGFERRDVRAAVAWQATTVAGAGLLFGLPLGVGIGRFAWNLIATDLGVVPDPVAPLWPGVLIVPATLLLANVVALLPGHLAARTRPALVLRAE